MQKSKHQQVTCNKIKANTLFYSLINYFFTEWVLFYLLLHAYKPTPTNLRQSTVNKMRLIKKTSRK